MLKRLDRDVFSRAAFILSAAVAGFVLAVAGLVMALSFFGI
jgi:hypothetical protein